MGNLSKSLDFKPFLYSIFCFAASVSSKLLTAFQSNMQGVKTNTLITKYPVHRYGIYKSLQGCAFLYLYTDHPCYSTATIPTFRQKNKLSAHPLVSESLYLPMFLFTLTKTSRNPCINHATLSSKILPSVGARTSTI